MEIFLLKFLAFLRPVLFMDTEVTFSGLNLLEWAAILFTGIIIAAFAIRAATHKNINLSVTDLVISGFVFWCMTIYVIYIDKSHISVLAKLVIPPLTYVVAKSVIPSREEYLKMVWVLILGFSIPLISSAFLILHGEGLYQVNYWTDLPRYDGIYSGPHDMAHNSAFLLMAIWIYLLVLKEKKIFLRDLSVVTKMVLILLASTAMYLLYMGSVRTTIVGLAVFSALLVTMHYKRPFLIFLAAGVLVSSFMLSDSVRNRFFPEGEWAKKDSNFVATDYGSNRPGRWKRQMAVFSGLPFDEQLAGIGIGNTLAKEAGEPNNYILNKDTHNDFFHVMVHTGIVGLLLFVALQVAIVRKILTLDSSVKYAFLAIVAAVTVMNFFSNSYVSRFGLGQMFYLLLAYIELRPSRSTETVESSS